MAIIAVAVALVLRLALASVSGPPLIPSTAWTPLSALHPPRLGGECISGRSAAGISQPINPALWSRSFAPENRTGDQHDAYSIAFDRTLVEDCKKTIVLEQLGEVRRHSPRLWRLFARR